MNLKYKIMITAGIAMALIGLQAYVKWTPDTSDDGWPATVCGYIENLGLINCADILGYQSDKK